MKNIFFLFCFLWATLNCFAQYTAIPDLNFENYLETNGMGDGIPNNGQVLTANISNVTVLSLQSMGISDLTGIEDFAALEILNCSNNFTMTNIDLSQNLALTALACKDGSLNTLILGNKPNLTYLDCEENYITELDLSQCPNLDLLICRINLLEQLDISQNTLLTFFECTFNELVEIDTSNNLLMTSFSCGFNNLVSIDISQNINLSHISSGTNPLEHLDARNGNNGNMTVNVIGTSGGLDCILVDDASATYLEDWHVDASIRFANNQEECDLLGVPMVAGNAIKIYPNPAHDIINVGVNEPVWFQLIDINGKVLKAGLLPEGQNSIGIVGLASGMYFFEIQTKDGTTVRKIIKQ